MTANRMKLRLGIRSGDAGVTVSLKTPLNPHMLDEAVESLSMELQLLAQDKERLRSLLNSFADEAWSQYHNRDFK